MKTQELVNYILRTGQKGYKDMDDGLRISDEMTRLVEEHIDQEVERRIAETIAGKFIAVEIEKRISERMPSLDDLDARLTEYLVGILDSVDFHEWLLSRLTSSEKQNNSQKTEGGEE